MPTLNRGPILLAACVLVSSLAATAEFVNIETKKVPVQRLAQNIERQLNQRPEDTALRLNLARLYAMAYALKVTEYEARSKDGEQMEAWFGHTPPTIPGPVKRASTAEQQERAKADLGRAIALYQDVVSRDAENFIAHLGLGWAFEQAGNKAEAMAEYRKVVQLAWPAERPGPRRAGTPTYMYGQEPATIEAAQRLKALLDPVADAKELGELQDKVRELRSMPRAITPIAIALRDNSMRAPLEADARVLFDADGSGLPKRWTWIDKDAGWLVYDADGTGEITTALQWFGSVTFWLFWSNGYEALAALDDNGDCALRGAELQNLAIWHDRNQNGVSERGEVRRLADHRITALSTRYETGDGLSVAAYSRRGVVFADGTTRPSFDVILHTREPRRSLTVPVH